MFLMKDNRFGIEINRENINIDLKNYLTVFDDLYFSKREYVLMSLKNIILEKCIKWIN